MAEGENLEKNLLDRCASGALPRGQKLQFKLLSRVYWRRYKSASPKQWHAPFARQKAIRLPPALRSLIPRCEAAIWAARNASPISSSRSALLQTTLNSTLCPAIDDFAVKSLPAFLLSVHWIGLMGLFSTCKSREVITIGAVG